jgi:hypothetical protein
MKTDISGAFQSIVRAAYEGIEFKLVAGSRPEDFIKLLVNDDVNYDIIAHLVVPCG